MIMRQRLVDYKLAYLLFSTSEQLSINLQSKDAFYSRKVLLFFVPIYKFDDFYDHVVGESVSPTE